MKANPELMLFAKIMLAIFLALGTFSLVLTIRSFYRPLDATHENATKFKKLLQLNWWIMFAAVGSAIHAVASEEYYMLGGSALLFSFVLPILVQYIRMKKALRKANPRNQTSGADAT
jgi:hypothetical protein